MDKRRKSFWSLILSLTLVMGMFWMVPKVTAASSGSAGVWTINTNLDVYSSTSIIDDAGNVLDPGDIDTINVVDGGDLQLMRDAGNTGTTVNVTSSTSSRSSIYVSGAELTCNSIKLTSPSSDPDLKASFGTNGTINIKNFDLSEMGSGRISNAGTINSETANLVSSSITFSNEGKLSVTDSVTLCEDFGGTLVTKNTTKVKGTTSGFFRIDVNGNTSTLSSGIDTKGEQVLAYTLLDPISDNSGFAKADDPNFLRLTTNSSEVYVSNGIAYGKGNSLKLIPATGYKIALDDKNFVDSITLSAAEYESFKSDLSAHVFRLLNTSTYRYCELTPNEASKYLSDFTFDNTAPEITSSVAIVDGKAENPVTDIDGKKITAKKVSVSIGVSDENGLSDTYLPSDTLNPATYTLDSNGKKGSLSHEFTVSSGDEDKEYTITVYDIAHNPTKVTLKLTYAKDPASVTVSISDVTIGGTPSPSASTIPTDRESDVKYYYKEKGAEDSTYTETVPTAAGDYTVKAVLPENDTYAEAEDTADFTINKKTPHITLNRQIHTFTSDRIFWISFLLTQQER